MWAFIFAGILYLTGVAVILVLKPSIMFTPDGVWKEFGIGKNEDRYTPFTFWLFCLVWAILSYIIVLLISPLFERSSQSLTRRNTKRNVRFTNDSDLVFDDEIESEPAEFSEPAESSQKLPKLPKGYYVLNRKASKIAGVPKYVFLGEDEP
jgi:hypothetical protein